MAVASPDKLAEQARRYGVEAWVCDYCHRIPGIGQPGLQFPIRSDGKKMLVEGECLRSWQATVKRVFQNGVPVQGGENINGRPQQGLQFRFQRR